MIERLMGDSLIAAAFVSYLGPFDTVYRYRGLFVRYPIYIPKPEVSARKLGRVASLLCNFDTPVFSTANP